MTLAMCQMQQVQVIRERIRVFEQRNRMCVELNRACAKVVNYPAANDDNDRSICLFSTLTMYKN